MWNDLLSRMGGAYIVNDPLWWCLMNDDDKKSILALIEKMRTAATAQDRDRLSADLATSVMMASEPELEWAEHPPVILMQGARTYRAYPITSSSASR